MTTWLVAWLLAATIYGARPRRWQNRWLALLLAIEGAFLGWGDGVLYLSDTAGFAWASLRVATIFGLGAAPAYVLFLGTLDTPLVRPLKAPWVRRASVGLLFVLPAIGLVDATLLFEGVRAVEYAPFESIRGPAFPVWALVNVALWTYGLAAAISAYRRTGVGSATRARAKYYAFAFGARDAGLIASAVLALTVQASNPSPQVDALIITTFTAPYLVFAGLLAYGILKTQLFGIELKVKLALRGSTVAAIFIATFFVVSELGVAFFEDRTQSQVLGILSTGLLVFAIAPLQRFAERISHSAMPNVRDDEAYLDARKLEVYQAALEEALEDDGTVTHTQTGYLSRLRTRLGISERDHALLQQAIVQARRGSPMHDASAYNAGTRILGRYRIEAEMGRGAHGVTYLAHDEQLDRTIVLKALPAHGEEPERILREARATCQLNHPNIVTVHDIERVGDEVYIVMEHVEGGSLAERLTEGPVDGASFEGVAGDLLAALEHVRGKGGIHRDVKPANVLITADGRAKLADFGIASLPGHEITVDLAGAEHAIGTVRYMSPEQAKGQLVDHRSDLYSAAVTLYEAYTGRPYVEPRKGESAIETQMRVARADTLDMAGSPITPRPLAAWFAHALHPSPDERPQTALEMRTALDEVLRSTA